MYATDNIVKKSAEFVVDLLDHHLPVNMSFHNKQHTELVVKATIEIAQQNGLNKNEIFILQTAAWFHDSGYCYSYQGHEDVSTAIAGTFLKQLDCSEEYIVEVMACINATKMPQIASNQLQQVICDADMYHFSLKDYSVYEQNLRKEWAAYLNKTYTDIEWLDLNINVLTAHIYFTDYGKTILQKRKQMNIERMQNFLSRLI
ncbi:hypothetical protein [Mucilaginibacter sp.]|uniref:HD domain-containing protein n=1 Tax=Mucilaginibacter sp. TaxID=1882438 RepID=UPI000CBCF2AA|nr:hypothetical protein [Mucilaginibacter sp.]PLW88731.1 MAG: hypothetical protein C0154_15110 [Mucilaginibacter sp.]PMP65680.1 MAG: hypothetical protein C0191_02930 [Mucilaginibacter sp.]HEK18967.1 hypothetical protein [Bacteroidota bacterium]